MVTFFSIVTLGAALAGSPGDPLADPSATLDVGETLSQVFTETLRQSIGAPARADIDDQATDRLSDDLMIVPGEQAARLLTVMARPAPADLKGLLFGSEGMEAAGMIRFIPAGFITNIPDPTILAGG